VSGRRFRATDTAAAARVAIVNETMARRYWPNADALGRRFRLSSGSGPWVEVVGIAANSTYLYFREPPQDMVYFPFRQAPHPNMVLLAETEDASASALDPLRALLQRMDPDVPVYDGQTIERFYDALVTGIARVAVSMIAGIGLMGMTLTMVGLYGLVSYTVSRRTREIGIRIAVGASNGRVLRMILRQGMTPAWCGLAAGSVLSVAATQLMPAFVPVSDRYDPRTFFLVVPMLLGVTLIAAFVPARRAARVDPTVALRCD